MKTQKPIDWQAFKTKIIFLYRVFNQLNLGLANPRQYFGHDIDQSKMDVYNSMLASIALALAFTNLRDESLTLTRESSTRAHPMAQVVLNEFIAFSDRAQKWKHTGPEETKEEAYYQMMSDYFDKTIAMLKDLIDPQPDKKA